MPRWGGRRSRRNGCCGRCCCRFSIPCGASGCWWSSCSTTCCSAGLWAWTWTKNHAVFSKNRERLLNEEVAEVFFQRVLQQGRAYLSDEHFTVDGTLLEAWASQKSFRRKDGQGGTPGGNREVDFHGEPRRNDTHQATTDPEARLYKKSKGSEAKLSYLGHALMENRNGLLVKTLVTEAKGTAERDAALLM